jgi:triphosphoribosyl-dephospho-CoA synthase
MELETWPKPGLVSHIDTGSHHDMSAQTFRDSASAIRPYFQALAVAGGYGSPMAHLRSIGMAAETAMLSATNGINTHRGAIFGMGLLCAAAGAKGNGVVDPHTTLGETASQLWGQAIVAGPRLENSHGSKAHMQFGVGGARAEAAGGFRTIYQVGLPALRTAREKCLDDPEAQRVEVCLSLIASLDDTNLLHRGGREGLRFAKRLARQFLDAGGIAAVGWQLGAQAIHEAFIERSLSPGGAADLLSMTLFIDAIEGS